LVISIIIINYNLADQVANCINSLLKHCNSDGFEIILLENGSTENPIYDLVNQLKSQPNLKLKFIESKTNLGFGQACNLAAENADNEVLFFLNPDTIIENNLIEKINSTIIPQFYTSNFIAGLKVNSTKFFDFSAGFFPNFLFEVLNIFLIGRFIEAFIIKLMSYFSKEEIIIDWVMGSAFIIRKDLFNKLSGFAPEFFLYFEEMDLCKRAKKLKFTIKYFHRISVNHLGSVGSKKDYYFFTKMFYKGKLLFLKKHNSKFSFEGYKIILKCQFHSQILFWKLFYNGSSKIASNKIKAFKELLNYLNYPENISNNLNA